MSAAALPVLRTPRLTLRPLNEDDADAIVRGVGNFDVSKWLAVVPYPYGREDALWFIRRVTGESRKVWAICDDEGLQGVCGMEEELGYWLARPAWGKGYAFEAARAVVEHWFDDQGNDNLESGYFGENERSGAVLRALGFVPSGQGMRRARSLNQDVASIDMLLTRARWQARQGFTLYTPRLTIRPFLPGDAPALAALASPEVARNLSRMRPGWSEEEAGALIAETDYQGVPGFLLAIEASGQVIGGLGLGNTPVEIAYFLARENWGQGLATEALSAFLPEVFERFPVNRLTADRFEDNPASGAILEKFGFVETGRSIGASKARLEPAPMITYAVTRETLRVPA